MSIPIMLAAGGLSIYEMLTEVTNLGKFLPIMGVGFVTAGVVGYLAIRWLLTFIKSHSLVYFTLYCFMLGVITILVWVLP
jgi:undecaprenyl-diphosphatase